MDEAIKQIGERLKGLREVLNIPAEEVAELAKSVWTISRLSREKPTLRVSTFKDFKAIRHRPRRIALSARNPHEGILRYPQGTGTEIDRNNQYKYQSLAVGFNDRGVNPFMVQVIRVARRQEVYRTRTETTDKNMIM